MLLCRARRRHQRLSRAQIQRKVQQVEREEIQRERERESEVLSTERERETEAGKSKEQRDNYKVPQGAVQKGDKCLRSNFEGLEQISYETV